MERWSVEVNERDEAGWMARQSKSIGDGAGQQSNWGGPQPGWMDVRRWDGLARWRSECMGGIRPGWGRRLEQVATQSSRPVAE